MKYGWCVCGLMVEEEEVKLTLRDRGSAVAEQGQTSLGYIRLCTEGAAAQRCTRGGRSTACAPLMKINEAHTLQPSPYKGTFPS